MDYFLCGSSFYSDLVLCNLAYLGARACVCACMCVCIRAHKHVCACVYLWKSMTKYPSHFLPYSFHVNMHAPFVCGAYRGEKPGPGAGVVSHCAI